MGGQRQSNRQREEPQDLFAGLSGEVGAVRVRLNGILERIRILERENEELQERLQEAEEELLFATNVRDILSRELERR